MDRKIDDLNPILSKIITEAGRSYQIPQICLVVFCCVLVTVAFTIYYFIHIFVSCLTDTEICMKNVGTHNHKVMMIHI